MTTPAIEVYADNRAGTKQKQLESAPQCTFSGDVVAGELLQNLPNVGGRMLVSWPQAGQ
jgi:hypothetical protein